MPQVSTPRILFHIGLHKTATTSLQVDTFPKISELNYLPATSASVRNYLNHVLACDPIYYSASSCASDLSPQLDENRLNLISSEALSGPAWVGVAQRGIDHRSPVLQNLKHDFPEAEILLILRRQDGYARSMYRQYVKSGGVASMARFLGMDSSQPDRPPLFARNRFYYASYVKELRRQFPAGVHVLFFEQFVSRPEEFLGKLAVILRTSNKLVSPGRRNSTRLGSRGLWVSRHLNRWFRNSLNPSALLPGLPRRRNGRWTSVSPVAILQDHWPGKAPTQSAFEKTLCETLLQNCYSDNRELAELLGVDLSGSGYY